MNKNLLIGVGVFLAVIVVGFFLVSKAPAPSKNTQTNLTNLKEFTVTGTEYSFSPSSINVKKGDNVKITFKNQGATAHNLTISDFNVSTNPVNPGDSDSFEFTADKTGTFDFYCNIDGHRGFGMKGTLEVN